MRIWLNIWIVISFEVVLLITVLNNQRSLLFIDLLGRKHKSNLVLSLILKLEAFWLVDLPNVYSGCGLILAWLGIFHGFFIWALFLVFGISSDSLQTQGGLDSHSIMLDIWFLGLNCDIRNLDCTVLSLDNSLSGNFLDSLLLLLFNELVSLLLLIELLLLFLLRNDLLLFGEGLIYLFLVFDILLHGLDFLLKRFIVFLHLD